MNVRRILGAAYRGLLLTALCAFPATAHAANWTVASTDDDNGTAACTAGSCPTFRDAITTAASGDSIDMGSLTGTITLTTGSELAIGQNLTITGPGANKLTLQAAASASDASSRVFEITAGTVAISGVAICNGNGTGGAAGFTGGGGVAVDSGATLNLNGCAISGNSAATGAGGGGITNNGTLTVTASTINGNSAGGYGGGIGNNGTLTVTNSTIANNSDITTGGGGIYNSSSGILTVNNGTIIGNSSGAERGGGIFDDNEATLLNTLVVGNTAPYDRDVSGDFEYPGTYGNNLIGDLSTDGLGFSTTTGDIFGSDANPIPLSSVVQTSGGSAVLTYHGGHTQTIALIPGSPAFDAGNGAVTAAPFSLTTDQRGSGYPRLAGQHVDIGAYELQGQPLLVQPQTLGSYSTGVTITFVATGGTGAATFTYTSPANGTLGALTNGDQLTYTPTPGYLGADSFTYTATDTNNDKSTATIAITVSAPPGLVVNTTADNDDGCTATSCSLRGAIFNANFDNLGPDPTIAFAIPASDPNYNGGSPVITLSGSPLTIQGSSHLFINTGNQSVTVDGNHASTVFQIASGTVTMTGMTVTGGSGAGLSGTGISIGTTLTIVDCTIFGNSSGGLRNDGTLTAINSTIAGNSFADGGGGILNAGTMSLVNCTICGNSSATIGGGIYNFGTASLLNTVVAGNTAPTDNDLYGAYDTGGTGGNNLIGDLSGDASGFSTANHDITGVAASAVFGTNTLTNNGGPTQTLALIAGSPAIDAGIDTVTGAPDSLTTDQRGTGYARLSGAHVDIGAYEYQQTAAPTISGLGNPTAYLPGSTGALSFTVGDAATSPSNLTVTAASSNTTVVPLTGIVLQGTGASRTVTVTPAAAGSSTITLTVADGNLTANTSFKVTAINTGLATVSLSPTPSTTNSSAPVTFTATYYDGNGVSDFKNLRLLVNSTATGASGLYFIYNHASNLLYMMKDDGITLQGGFVPGSANVIENSQGILNCAATTVTTSGNTVTVKWNVTPFGQFAGAHNLYMECDDPAGTVAGFNLMGIWAVNLTTSNNLPEVQSLTPATAASQSSTALTLSTTVADPNAVNNISQSRILINANLNAPSALYGLYDNVANRLYLFNDAGTAITGGITPGTNAIIENSQGILNCAATTVTRTATQLTVNWSFTPNGFFTGTKQTYALVKDISGLTDGWRTMGTWAITKNSTGDSPLALSVTPLSTTSTEGTAETLTATYESPDGYANLNTCRILVNGALNAPNALYAEYNRASNLLYLFNNAGTGITGGFAPGSANVITNSQGTLNCAATHVTAGGNSLVITWNFTPNATFTGAKNVYLLVSDNEGLTDGWRALATWQINAATGAFSGGTASLSTSPAQASSASAVSAAKGPSSHAS